MEKKVNRIDQDTVIPIGLLITIIGGVYWLSNLSFTANASEKEIVELKSEIKVLNTINYRLKRLEDHFGIKGKVDEE